MRINLLLIILISISGYSQKYPHQLPYYDFINYDSNIIQHYKKGNALSYFYSKLDSTAFLGEGQPNILHLGGSHLQADIWSGQLRTHLQNIQVGMKSSRGLVFPFDIAKTNNPSNYKTTYTGSWTRKRCATRKATGNWGLTGMQVSTYDTNASFQIFAKSRFYQHYDFKKARIYYEMDSTSLLPVIYNQDSVINYKMDSISGYLEVEFLDYADTLFVALQKQDSNKTKFTLYGIEFLTDEPGIIYSNIGVNGADVPSYLKCNLMDDQAMSIQPDLIIFSVGVNDAYTNNFKKEQYEANYDSLIRRFRSINPEVSILFTTNNDTYYRKKYPNKNAHEVREVMQNLSKKYNCAIWDMFEVMGGLGSIDKWVELDLAKSDKIHFKGDGYRLIGDLMFSALMKDYQIYLREKHAN